MGSDALSRWSLELKTINCFRPQLNFRVPVTKHRVSLVHAHSGVPHFWLTVAQSKALNTNFLVVNR